MNTTRRGFMGALAALVAAPAIPERLEVQRLSHPAGVSFYQPETQRVVVYGVATGDIKKGHFGFVEYGPCEVAVRG